MFNKSNFCHIASNNRNEQKGSVFIYKTTDTLAQVTQSGYFNEKLIDINVHDLIIHVQYDPVARTLKKSVLIVTERTLDNVETAPIIDQTIGEDIDQLGDQVQGIEEKIPENASRTNQLATKNQITDLQNTKQDKATAINYDNITNCITKIPQDIKLDLNNGTLTLKAGSKAYRPNGAGVFTQLTNAADRTLTYTANGTYMVFSFSFNSITLFPVSSVFSGATAPSVSGVAVWYDTTNNVIKATYDSGSTWEGTIFLPLGVVTVSSGAISSIDQVFNGFGYIGSTVFTLPGVKGLIPDGRNADGTLKNGNVICNSVQISSNFTGTEEHVFLLQTNGKVLWYNRTQYIYDKENNYIYNANNGEKLTSCVVGTFDVVNDKVQNFKPFDVFRAVDYNDTEYIAHQAMPSDRYVDLTLPTSDGTITAPADGYIVFHKASNAAGQRIGLTVNTGARNIIYSSDANQYMAVTIPVQKGNVVTIHSSAKGETTAFRFVYANGSK